MATTKEEIKDGPIGDTSEDEAVEFVDSDVTDDGFVQEQVGFPPYFKPIEGRKIKFRPISIDMRDARFFRWVCEASHNIACWTGPKDDAEPVLVRAGEFFTMSVYASLPLERFLGEEIIAIVKSKRDIHDGQSVWIWNVLVKPEVKKNLELKAKAKLEKQLAEIGANGELDNVYEMAKNSKLLAEKQIKEAKQIGGRTRA